MGKRGKRSVTKPSGEQVCGTCSRDPGDNPIGCDDCEVWVHGTEMCSGLPMDLIEAILNYGGEGIKFICMRCRLKPPSPSGDGAGSSAATDKDQSHLVGTMQQMFQQFRGMCNIISDLSDEMKCLAKAIKSPPAQSLGQATEPAPPPPGPDPSPKAAEQPAIRAVIAEELREIREREKRKQSIIIKGLRANSSAEVVHLFKDLSSTKLGCEVTLSDVSPIKDHAGMFRAKIMSDDQRKHILDNAKTLKGTRYDGVYISRDLTRAQRTVLFEKRQAKRTQNPTTSEAPPPRPATNQPPPTTPVHPAPPAASDATQRTTAATREDGEPTREASRSTSLGN